MTFGRWRLIVNVAHGSVTGSVMFAVGVQVAEIMEQRRMTAHDTAVTFSRLRVDTHYPYSRVMWTGAREYGASTRLSFWTPGLLTGDAFDAREHM